MARLTDERLKKLPPEVKAMLTRTDREELLLDKVYAILGTEPKSLNVLIVELWEKYKYVTKRRDTVRKTVSALVESGHAKRQYAEGRVRVNEAAYVRVEKTTKPPRTPHSMLTTAQTSGLVSVPATDSGWEE